MPIVYLLITMSWVPIYFLFTLASVCVVATLWFLAINSSGLKKGLSCLGVLVSWVLAGMTALGISYYG